MPGPVSTVEIDHLTKYYGPHRGVEDLTLRAEPGGVLGFLGPNGSGKTTTIRGVLGFLRPPSRRAAVGGGGGGGGGEEAPRAAEIARALEAPMDRPMKKCSRGMRQKVALVITLAHDPEVLILDEPTSGLDPLAQRTLLELLDQEGKRGKTVFFSSHVLSEAEHICDRVAILREGRLVVLDKVEKLRERKYKEVTLVYSG